MNATSVVAEIREKLSFAKRLCKIFIISVYQFQRL